MTDASGTSISVTTPGTLITTGPDGQQTTCPIAMVHPPDQPPADTTVRHDGRASGAGLRCRPRSRRRSTGRSQGPGPGRRRWPPASPASGPAGGSPSSPSAAAVPPSSSSTPIRTPRPCASWSSTSMPVLVLAFSARSTLLRSRPLASARASTVRPRAARRRAMRWPISCRRASTQLGREVGTLPTLCPGGGGCQYQMWDRLRYCA
jgi:hypothetical protein